METIVVGIDVAKDRLDVAVRPSGDVFAVARNGAGLAALCEKLVGLDGRSQRDQAPHAGKVRSLQLRKPPALLSEDELLAGSAPRLYAIIDRFKGADTYVAHNCEFERSFLTPHLGDVT